VFGAGGGNDEVDGSVDGKDQHHRINELAVVVAGDDRRAFRRNVFRPDDVDLSEVQLRNQAG
jgi:hypothetical protein